MSVPNTITRVIRRSTCDACDEPSARLLAVDALLDGATYPGLVCPPCWRRYFAERPSADALSIARAHFAVSTWRQAFPRSTESRSTAHVQEDINS